VVLGEPGAVEAKLFGEPHLLDRHAENRRRRLISAVLRHQVEERDFHTRPAAEPETKQEGCHPKGQREPAAVGRHPKGRTVRRQPMQAEAANAARARPSAAPGEHLTARKPSARMRAPAPEGKQRFSKKA
jgi:hypothetical protein